MKKSCMLWQVVCFIMLLFICTLIISTMQISTARAATGNALHDMSGPGSGVQPGQLWAGGKDQGHQQNPAWVKLKSAGLVHRGGNGVTISLAPQQVPPDLSANAASTWSVILLTSAGIFLALLLLLGVRWWIKQQHRRVTAKTRPIYW